MRSSHGNELNLLVCDNQLTTMLLDNHVCISDQYDKNNALTVTLALHKSDREKLLGSGSGVVQYPVMYSPEIKQGQIFIPPEIRKDMSISLGKRITCELKETNRNKFSQIEELTFEILNFRHSHRSGVNASANEISDEIKTAFRLYPNAFPLVAGQVIVVPFRGGRLDLRVNGAFYSSSENSKKKAYEVGCIGKKTRIQLINTCVNKVNMLDSDVHFEFELPPIESIPLDLTERGIGGFKQEISQLIRSVFYTRAIKHSFLEAYGVKKHAKGILFYGPPGTGKTLIALEISKLFTKEPLIVIEGPQLKNSYYGATQNNLANLFDVAKGNPHKLYVYLFDELDALFGVRGSDNSVSMSNNNDLVNRFCSILDGNHSPENIIIMGTTNRKELIDPALLRAGRLDTQIYIGLPSEEDRLEILQVHTRSMSQTMAADVDLRQIAQLTRNYSGAELARLVRVAMGYALEKNFSSRNNMLLFRPDIKSVAQAEKVTHACFLRAIQEVKPMFGADELCSKQPQKKFIVYEEALQSIVNGLSQCILSLRDGEYLHQLNILIEGGAGTGKTSLAHYLAGQSGFPHIQVLTANKLLPHTLPRQLEIIDEIFTRASQSSEPSVIVLENIENLIEASSDLGGYNNKLRLKFNEMLKRSSEGSSKVLVMATTDSLEFQKRIGLGHYFSEAISLQPIRLDCRHIDHVVSVVSKLAKAIGAEITNDLTSEHIGLSFNIPIKDLVYQMNKYSTYNHKLKLSEFISGLPTRFISPEETVLQNDSGDVPRALFRISR